MQPGITSILLLKKLVRSKKSHSSSAAIASAQKASTSNKSPKDRFQDWLSPKPEPIQIYPGETEIFRKGLILVTDTRLAYIDPFDRMLKTFMFEHMISVHKQFYRTTVFNRRLCKSILVLSILALVVVSTIDLFDNKSSGFALVYLPLFASIILGVKVWRDMKPWYVIHWRMSDHTYGEISQEPLLSERIAGDNKREEFMTDLANAMNHALSAKVWRAVSDSQITSNNPEADTTAGDNKSTSYETTQANSQDNEPNSKESRNGTLAPKLSLVTDNYR